MRFAEQTTKSKHEALQSQFDLLNEKIKRLREARAIETDVATRFKLDKQIEQEEADRDAIERQLKAGELKQSVQKPRGQHIVPIPNILPYLSDRSEQEKALKKALETLQETKSRRPFVCVIHGDEYECHDMFLERLRHAALPRILNLDTERVFIKNYLLKWPSSSDIRQKRFEAVRENLLETITGNSSRTSTQDQEMFDIISHHEVPVMIETHLNTEDWLHSGPDLIKDFILFWNRWPNLAPGQFLIICLCLEYKSVDSVSFWQKSKFAKLNDKISGLFDQIDFAKYDHLHGVTLPKLRAISRKDVEDWVREHAREFCQIDELQREIRALYENVDYHTRDGCIHMDKLARELKKLLNAYRY
jgi:hypothetical protein